MQATSSDRVYEGLRSALLRGEFRPRQRLVARKIAAKLGVGLGSVQEAINRLAADGLVDHARGGGACVPIADLRELEELYLVRDLLESCAAGEAAKHISEHQIHAMRGILKEWDVIGERISAVPEGHATTAQLQHWVDLEVEFHDILIKASRNRSLVKAIREHRAIRGVFSALRRDAAILTNDVAKQTCENRSDLLRALRERDTPRSRELMSVQIHQGRSTVLSFIRNL